MKKRKLLTSLSSLGVLAAAAPIVAPSCSSDNISYANGMIFDGKVYEIEKNCDLNSFCWVPTLFSTTEYFMSIKLANGDYFNITKDNKDKLTKLKITDINKSVKFIANDFLSDMPCLKSLEIGDYSHITEIGDRFLLANTLSTVDISTFTNVELIGDDFLAMSYNLTGPEIKDPTNGYQKLHTIGKHFIAGCPKFTTADLTSFNYSPIANRKIGEGMYSDCYNLKTVYAGKITPANMGYDTWVVEGTPAKWSRFLN